jgi:hypothetical protein
MPILTATNPLRKRRPPVWVRVLAGALLTLQIGVFAWSWYEPITLFCGEVGLVFGYQKGARLITEGWPSSHSGVWFVYRAPWEQPSDGYAVGWKKRLPPSL